MLLDKYTKAVREIDEKLEIQLRRDQGDELISPWHLTNFISSVSTIFYKNELLNTMRSLIHTGTPPNSIFIADKSFLLKNKYKFLNEGQIDLNETKGVPQFYHLGIPIPLRPNKKIYYLNFFFNTFGSIYTAINQLDEVEKRINLEDKEDLLNQIYTFVKNNKEKITSKMALDFLRKIFDAFFKQYNLKLDYLSDILNKNKKRLSNFDKYNNDELQLTIIDNDISESRIFHSEEFKNNLIFDSYYLKFERYFKSFSRPILGVYDEKSEIINIMCIDFINSNYYKSSNTRFLDIKNMSRNSPLLLTILGGISIAPALISCAALEYQKLSQRHENDNEIKQLKKRIDYLEDQEKKLDELKKLNIAKTYKATSSTEDVLIEHTLKKLEEKNNKDLHGTIKENDFEFNLIDFKKEHAK